MKSFIKCIDISQWDSENSLLFATAISQLYTQTGQTANAFLENVLFKSAWNDLLVHYRYVLGLRFGGPNGTLRSYKKIGKILGMNKKRAEAHFQVAMDELCSIWNDPRPSANLPATVVAVDPVPKATTQQRGQRTDISKLNLGTKLTNILRGDNIHTIGKLREYSDVQLREIPLIGDTFATRILNAIDDFDKE